jgi:FixJ family two-component response regulator
MTSGQTTSGRYRIFPLVTGRYRLRQYRASERLCGNGFQELTITMTDRPPGFTVAVVDDDQSLLQSLENLLESAGHGVSLFTSARALLESGVKAEIGCLISDINMPVMNGLELARAVHVTRPELSVILVTGHPEMLNRSPPADRSHYRLLTKPFNPQELLAAVSEALRALHPS